MAKRKAMPTDLNQRAKAIVDLVTSDDADDVKDEKAIKNGRSGGHTRAVHLTPAERSDAARHAARARWDRASR